MQGLRDQGFYLETGTKFDQQGIKFKATITSIAHSLCFLGAFGSPAIQILKEDNIPQSLWFLQNSIYAKSGPHNDTSCSIPWRRLPGILPSPLDAFYQLSTSELVRCFCRFHRGFKLLEYLPNLLLLSLVFSF